MKICEIAFTINNTPKKHLPKEKMKIKLILFTCHLACCYFLYTQDTGCCNRSYHKRKVVIKV